MTPQVIPHRRHFRLASACPEDDVAKEMEVAPCSGDDFRLIAAADFQPAEVMEDDACDCEGPCCQEWSADNSDERICRVGVFIPVERLEELASLILMETEGQGVDASDPMERMVANEADEETPEEGVRARVSPEMKASILNRWLWENIYPYALVSARLRMVFRRRLKLAPRSSSRTITRSVSLREVDGKTITMIIYSASPRSMR